MTIGGPEQPHGREIMWATAMLVTWKGLFFANFSSKPLDLSISRVI